MAMMTDKTGVRYRWTNKSKILTDEIRTKHGWTTWKGESNEKKSCSKLIKSNRES
jgi:hypothetical protein